MSQGDHHHFLWLRPEAQIEVLTPISPHIELGTLDVTMELSTQVNIFKELPFQSNLFLKKIVTSLNSVVDVEIMSSDWLNVTLNLQSECLISALYSHKCAKKYINIKCYYTTS